MFIIKILLVKILFASLVTQSSNNASTRFNKHSHPELLSQSLDRKIDEAVYELYGLTEEEIKIVEGK